MNDKVKLPKEIVDALDYLKSGYDYPIRKAVDLFGDSSLAAEQMLDPLIQYFQSDRSRRIGLIMQALVNGYEVEQTPEEQIREWFQEHWENQKTFSVNREMSREICVTITRMLKILGIKIKGVNAE